MTTATVKRLSDSDITAVKGLLNNLREILHAALAVKDADKFNDAYKALADKVFVDFGELRVKAENEHIGDLELFRKAMGQNGVTFKIGVHANKKTEALNNVIEQVDTSKSGINWKKWGLAFIATVLTAGAGYATYRYFRKEEPMGNDMAMATASA